MLRPTFLGFETAKRGLTAAQKGLDIAGQNLTNWDSAGYTRQRITQVALAPDSYRSRYATSKVGLAGQGVEITGIDQTRDVFLDKRFREENGDLGYYGQAYTVLADIQASINEFNPDKDSNIVLTAAGEDKASNTTVTVTTKPINAGVEFGDALAAGDVLKIDGKTYTIGGAANEEKLVFANGADLATYLKKNGYDLITKDTGASANDFAANTILVKTGEGGLSLQIGATGDEYNKVTVSVGDMSSKGLGINNLRDTGIMTQDAASAALDQIKNGASSAINMVSSQRAELGAMQNRLEHTINNLDVAAENMESANSQIRDTDMAKEMMEYTKQNVLTQAAQAMLAQANQQPQSILQLLQ